MTMPAKNRVAQARKKEPRSDEHSSHRGSQNSVSRFRRTPSPNPYRMKAVKMQPVSQFVTFVRNTEPRMHPAGA